MVLQMRDPDNAVLDRLEAAVTKLVDDANSSGPCKVSIEQTRRTEPAVMAPQLMDAIRDAAEAHVPGRHVDMPSGAGHDAMVFSRHMPSAMLFVPSIDGISHHWTENTSDEDIVMGARVYLDAAAGMLKAARDLSAVARWPFAADAYGFAYMRGGAASPVGDFTSAIFDR